MDADWRRWEWEFNSGAYSGLGIGVLDGLPFASAACEAFRRAVNTEKGSALIRGLACFPPVCIPVQHFAYDLSVNPEIRVQKLLHNLRKIQ
jgi:hypothetical protein